MKTVHTIALIVLWHAYLAVGVVARELPVRPNILLVTSDNLGYGDLRCYDRDSKIITPHLNRLAAEGARLTSFYTASPTCTVSRACLLTGRVADRHGLTNQLPGLKGNYGPGLDSEEILIPQVLQAAGYRTGCFGKWNIGFAPGSRPTERGFDVFLGHASGNMDYYHHTYNGKHDLYRGTQEYDAEGVYASDLFADAAIDFIERGEQDAQPWLCYLPFNAPHFPNAKNKRPGQANVWQAPSSALEAYGWSPDEPDPVKRYAAVVTAMDRSFGRVLESLEKTGQADQTFVFWCSDNGAFRLGRDGIDVGSNHPLRDGGVTCWEGGIRVAAIAKWPGKIPPGSVASQPLWMPDLMVACAALAQTDLPDDVVLDGKNPLPVLTGQASSPHRSLYFSFRSHAALRMREWKIVRTRPDGRWQLFNLTDDAEESLDLAEERPEMVRQLADEFASWQNSIRLSESLPSK